MQELIYLVILCVFHWIFAHIPGVQAILGIEVVQLTCKTASLSLQPGWGAWGAQTSNDSLCKLQKREPTRLTVWWGDGLVIFIRCLLQIAMVNQKFAFLKPKKQFVFKVFAKKKMDQQVGNSFSATLLKKWEPGYQLWEADQGRHTILIEKPIIEATKLIYVWLSPQCTCLNWRCTLSSTADPHIKPIASS